MIEGGKYKIQFMYERNPYNNQPVATTCVVETEGKAFEGKSFCHDSDNFNKETGRKLALRRAIEDFDLTTRTIIWHLYFSRGTDKCHA